MIREWCGGHALTVIVLSASLLSPSTPAEAQACTVPTVDNATEAIQGIDDLLLGQCLGGANCEIGECAVVAQLTGAPDLAGDQLAEQIFIVLRQLHAKALTLDETQLAVSELRGMLARWDMPTLGNTGEESLTVLTDSNKREWQGSQFNLFLHTPFELNLEKAFLETHCGTPDLCRASFESAVAVYTLSGLIHRTLDVAVRQQLEDVGRMLKTYDARWSNFHTGSRAVFPWELVFNNLSYRGASEGFSGPPSWQWLVLHPSIGLSYDDDQDDKMQEAILVDIVGRYQWRWGGKDNAEMKRPWGAAVAMSWTGDDPGYGLAVHLPKNWSIAVTRSSGESIQLLFSMEFAQFVTDKQKNVEEFRQQLEDLRF